MKKTVLIFLIASTLFFLPSYSYALFDAGFYGGYSPFNKVKRQTDTIRPYGWDFGFIAHYNLDVVPKILNFGIGMFYQMSLLTHETNNQYYDYEKHDLGINTYLQIEVDFVVLPFIRFSVSLWQDANGSETYFQSFFAGGGLEFPIVWKMRLYVEYLYSALVHDEKMDYGHTFNWGIRFKM